MKNINEEFGKDFAILERCGNDFWNNLCDQIKALNNIPALTNTDVCRQLEGAYLDVYNSSIKLAEVALQSSRLYRDIYIINNLLSENFNED